MFPKVGIFTKRNVHLDCFYKWNFKVATKEKKHTGLQDSSKDKQLKKLILWNDEVNSFDFVIESLVEVCGHDPMQAETCTWIAHFKGKCPVMTGTFEELKPIYTEMSNRKLTTEIK